MSAGERQRPLVALVCDRFFVGEHDLHSAKHSYVRALISCSRVNPLHRQGVAKLAWPLAVEARAPGGLIEAFPLDGNDFALGVQWRPETALERDGTSRLLFEAFGASRRRYAAQYASVHRKD